MSDETPVLPVAEARKRFVVYAAVKLGGLAALFGGVILEHRGGITVVNVLLIAVGAACLFVRPRMLGLTRRPGK